MVYLLQQYERLLAETDREARIRDLQSALAELAPRLAAKRNEYRHFGPYWWWIKPLVRQHRVARRGWLRGGYVDRSFLERVRDTVPPVPDDEIAWIGLQYYRAEILDETPAAMHIVDAGRGEAFVYHLYDPDASEQMDLFAEPDQQGDLQALLADPGRFSGSAWLQRGDQYMAEGDLLRSAAAFRRAIHRAVSDGDRTNGWIRLGQLFQEHNHTAKAILCYHNAWERDRESWIQGLIAEVYLDSGRPHEALTHYEAALKAMPGNPEYRAGVDRCHRIIREHAEAYSFSAEPLAT